MNLKKFLQVTFIVCSLAMLSAPNVHASVPSANTSNLITNEEEPSERAKALIIRLFEIKNMDKSTLTNSDKQALRKELRGMKKEMKASTGLDSKVYISIGAIIIIILLIILLR
jgi:hypothetical protein